MKQTIPFTYLIGWSKLDIWYYGVRYKKGTSPIDLWTVYFTSSKRVERAILNYGQPDVIQIRRTFNTATEACDWETKVLKRMNAARSQRWLNQTDNKAIIQDDISINKMRNTWFSKSEDERAEINSKKSMPGELNPMYGVHRFGEDAPTWGWVPPKITRERIGDANRGRIWDKDYPHPNKGRKWDKDTPHFNAGKTRSDEEKKRQSEFGKTQFWWNNGTEKKRGPVCPGEGWIRGRGKIKNG